MPYGHASMLLLGEGSEATEPYNKYDKIRPHSIRSLQFDQKVRPLSFRPQKFDLFTATLFQKPADELQSDAGTKCYIYLHVTIFIAFFPIITFLVPVEEMTIIVMTIHF